MSNKRHLRLNSPRDIKRFLANLINRLMREEVEGQLARDAGYLAKILLDCMEKVDLEIEIEKIKKRLGMQDNDNEERIGSH